MFEYLPEMTISNIEAAVVNRQAWLPVKSPTCEEKRKLFAGKNEKPVMPRLLTLTYK
jgi:hypothetical protein